MIQKQVLGLLSFLVLMGMVPAEARTKALMPCDAQTKRFLMREIRDLAEEDVEYTVLYMRNGAGELVGYFAFGSGPEDARAGVCNVPASSNPEVTAATSWYYWDRQTGSTNPSSWEAGKRLYIYQDEGFLRMRVVKASAKGFVQLAVEVEGVGLDEGHPEAIVARDLVRLSAR